MDYPVLDHYVIGIKDIGTAKAFGKFFPKLVQRGVRAVLAGFDLYRRYLSLFGYQKIYLHVVLPVIGIVP